MVAAAAFAREPPSLNLSPPVVLRLEGHFANDRTEAAANGADPVSMRIGDRDRWFSTVRVRTVGSDQPRTGRDILATLAPVQPNLIVVGAEELRQRLDEADVGAPIEVEGLLSGSRTLLLRAVGVQPPMP